ncbi:MAG: DUF898 family protein, partial [Acidobacteria bacterium]|nr:DUF898 family protein [Acidobacteriota bacterium]
MGSGRWLVAQEKWTKYLEAGKKESYELKVEDWLAAEKALPELPKSDWWRLFVVNRLLDACDVAEWDSECGGANRRPELLKSAISISKEIHPEGIPFADELVHLSKQFEIPEGLNQALATVSDSLAMVEKLEGPKSVAASKRYLQIANLQRQSKNPKSMLENLRQAVDLQMEYRGPARRDRFELYIDALQEFEEKQEPDFQREVYEKAREEARRLYLRNWKELLAAYRTLISSSQERLRWELIAEYRQVVTKELASGKPESVDALIELAKKIRYTDKPKAREIWTEALRVLRLQDKAVKLAEHNRREGEVFAGLAGLDEIEKKFGIAAENYERAAEAFEGLRDIDKSWLPDAWLDAVTNHLKSGNVNLAEKCFAAGLNDARSNAVAKLAYVAESFGDLYLAKRQPAEAVKKFEIAVAAKESLNQLDTYPNGVLSKLAKGYELAGRMKEASAVQQRILNDQMSATKDALSKDGPQKAFRTALLAWGGTIVVLLGLFLAMQRKVQRRVRELSEGSFGSVKIAPTQMLGLTEESAPAVQEPVFEWNPKVPPTNRFVYHGVGTDLFGMRIYHLLLTILTLGVFSFWGKTRVRKYLCSQAEFLGDRFCFHGTGKELFQGWLKGVPLLG